VRALALKGQWPAVEATLAGWATQPDNSNFYWFMSARLAMWRRDAAWAARVRDAVQALDFPLKQPVIDFSSLTITGEVNESLTTMAGSWGKMSSRAVRRPLFFRQLSTEVFAFIGGLDSALDAIESAANIGLIDIAWVDHCPLLDPLRTTPRFTAARAKIADRARAALDALNGRARSTR
jgi:hypothetical protein